MIERTQIRLPIGDSPATAHLIYGQDCAVSLRGLPEKSVHMVATSPPYYGLRNYGTGRWEGGDATCTHEGTPACSLCGALWVDLQVGLEQTPQEYVQRLVEVFREVRRVLRDDGVVWLNLGDSYATPLKGIGGDKGFSAGGTKRKNNRTQPKMDAPVKSQYGDWPIKSKDILGIPWRVAFALQADGWYLRQDIVWAKPNPMPSSVTDRCTTAHEYIFLLAKSERYFFDSESIKEPSVMQPQNRITKRSEHPKGDTGRGEHVRPEGGTAYTSRNKRSVWTITTKPYAGAHFATWPMDLVEVMVKAGSSEAGCCPTCKAPQSRMTVKKPRGYDGSEYGEHAVAATGGAISGGTKKSTLGSSNGTLVNETVTTGWRATCTCDSPVPTIPCTVLDIFSGSATTGRVALKLGRNYIGLDLNETYLPLAEARLEGRRPPQASEDDGEGDILELLE